MDLSEEQILWDRGVEFVAGLDEVGRGPLAGPVVAAAVVIKDRQVFNDGKFEDQHKARIRDSKKLSPNQRERIFDLLNNNGGIDYAIGIVSEKDIDKINILEASLLAMKQAIGKLKIKPGFLLIDGKFTLEDLPINQKAIIGGDDNVFSIALASIIAKVTRDRLMVMYHRKYPNYGFDKHKGYGTKFHMEALKKFGVCDIHRKSFRPVKKIL